jgi:hypothetical protein
LTTEQALDWVKRLEVKLGKQATEIAKPLEYYGGEHSLAFATPEFRAAMGGLFNDFSDNWCGVVVDSVAERLRLRGFRAADSKDAHAASWDLWTRSNADADLNPALVTALAASRSAAIVWYPDSDGAAPEITFEHPSEVVVGYVAGSRRRRVAALKVWSEDERLSFATLYTSDEVWKFQREGTAAWFPRQGPDDASWPLRHDLGAVPVVELRNKPDLLGNAYSEITQVIPKQDAVNLLWAHVFTASDAAALPQRVVIGAAIPKVPVLDDSGAQVATRDATKEEIEKFRQNRLGWIPDPNARTAEWSAARLSEIVSTIRVLVQHVAAQSKTPPDYMLGDMANLSGDALSAAERGLVSKVRERQTDFGDPLREVMRLAHLAAGSPGDAAAIAGGSVVWADPEHRTMGELVDALTKQMSIGVPMEALWERLPDVDAPEIARWKQLRRDFPTAGLVPAFVPPAAPAA